MCKGSINGFWVLWTHCDLVSQLYILEIKTKRVGLYEYKLSVVYSTTNTTNIMIYVCAGRNVRSSVTPIIWLYNINEFVFTEVQFIIFYSIITTNNIILKFDRQLIFDKVNIIHIQNRQLFTSIWPSLVYSVSRSFSTKTFAEINHPQWVALKKTSKRRNLVKCRNVPEWKVM